MPLETIERVLWLKRAELFGPLNAEDLAPLAQRAREAHFAAGEVFIRQGEPGDCLYLILDGEAEIRVSGVRVAGRGPGTAIGEFAVLFESLRSADCMALTDITALQINHDDFQELLAERPALAHGVIEVLGRRLAEAVGNLKRLGQRDQEGTASLDTV